MSVSRNTIDRLINSPDFIKGIVIFVKTLRLLCFRLFADSSILGLICISAERSIPKDTGKKSMIYPIINKKILWYMGRAKRVPKNTRAIPTTTPGKAYPIKLIDSMNRFMMLGYRINFSDVAKASKAITVVARAETISELSIVLRDNIIDSPCANPLNNQNINIVTGIINAILIIVIKNKVIGYFHNPRFIIFGLRDVPLPIR